MRNYISKFCLVFGLLALLCGGSPASDLEAEIQQVYAKVQLRLPALQDQINEGKLTEANESLLAIFPASDRTAAQTLMLGNLLYGMDAKLSYALHKDAFERLPDHELTLLEWAMEQHRAGEYKGALDAYDKYSSLKPNFAPVHGLAADCLIRLGQNKEACKRWLQSERATSGSLEKLEEMVCEIYKDSTIQQRRAKLRESAANGNIEALLQLIALDAKFEKDWWNNGPHRTYLAHDLPLLEKHSKDPRVRAAQCAGECILEKDPDKAKIGSILQRYGYLIGGNDTLPADSRMLGLILGSALEADVYSTTEMRERFGQAFVKKAIATKDAELFNIAAHLHIGEKQMEEIERQGYEATGEARFAIGYLIELLRNDTLTADHPILAKALAQFPEDSQIALIAFQLKKNPDEKFLVQAIKAEFRRFSVLPGLISRPRPSAKALRVYFAKLSETLAVN